LNIDPFSSLLPHPMLLILHLVVTAAYCAVLWVVQLLIYPQFERVPTPAFGQYHQEHCRRMGWIVGPIFVIEGITALILAWQLWALQPILQTASLVFFIIGHGITFVIFVPLHQQLAQGQANSINMQRLVQLNWFRTAAMTVRLGVVISFSFILLDCVK